jgi:transposase InsO family protein
MSRPKAGAVRPGLLPGDAQRSGSTAQRGWPLVELQSPPAASIPSPSSAAVLECELLDRRRFPTQAEARMAVFDFIEGWYNPHRRHSGLDYESPISYEQRHPVVA